MFLDTFYIDYLSLEPFYTFVTPPTSVPHHKCMYSVIMLNTNDDYSQKQQKQHNYNNKQKREKLFFSSTRFGGKNDYGNMNTR